MQRIYSPPRLSNFGVYLYGDLGEARTRDTAVKGQWLNHLPTRPHRYATQCVIVGCISNPVRCSSDNFLLKDLLWMRRCESNARSSDNESDDLTACLLRYINRHCTYKQKQKIRGRKGKGKTQAQCRIVLSFFCDIF